MLGSVVMNLVINARHAMLNSPVKKLTVQTAMEKDRAFIKVKDTGCGIPKKDLPRVFDPFFTTKGSLSAGQVFDGKARGTGLGLSVCHSVVEGHGGEIKVKSQLGKGTTFTVYLPASSKRKTTRREVKEKRKEGVSPILVIDDEEAIADLLVDILVHGGYEAVGFTNPTEAVKSLRHQQYSLAFLDLQMPGMAGEDLMAKMNGIPPEKRPLKVVVTGRLDVSERDYTHLDVFATLPKPFSTQRVLEIVEKGLAGATYPASEGKEKAGPE